METYPEMNSEIVKILNLSDGPTALYAAARIQALETALRRVIGAADAVLRNSTEENIDWLRRELSNAEIELNYRRIE